MSDPAAPRRPEEFHSLAAPELERFLKREKASSALPDEPDLALHLRQILERANALVPSRSGSILLDDPLRKVEDLSRNDLSFMAAFGPGAAVLPGTRVAGGRGICGLVYRTGRPHLAGSASDDDAFAGEVDQLTGHTTHSVIAAPVAIGGTVIGVIELVDRLDGQPYDRRDLALLEIFAGLTSSTLQNALDAKRLHELARRDDLTALYNDRWLHLRLVELIDEADATGQPLTLIFFDLDRFKSVNDSHGHLAGSEVLRQMGFLLRRTVDEPHAVLARYGGDEFVIALPAVALEPGTAVAERIRVSIERATFLDRPFGPGLPALHLRGSISASVGVATYVPGTVPGPAHRREADLLRRADTAMYAAKARGKNLVVASEE